MKFEFKCNQGVCQNKATLMCDQDSCHRYCENCMKKHLNRHKANPILIEAITKKYEKLRIYYDENFKKYKLDIMNYSAQLIECINECTQQSLKALNARKIYIDDQMNDLIKLEKLKSYGSTLNLIYVKKNLYDKLTSKIKSYFKNQHVNII